MPIIIAFIYECLLMYLQQISYFFGNIQYMFYFSPEVSSFPAHTVLPSPSCELSDPQFELWTLSAEC